MSFIWELCTILLGMDTKLIDITRGMAAGMAVWDGDTPFRLEQILDLHQGDAVNLTTMTVSAHMGTHVDAPSHFDIDGGTMSQVALDVYWGRAQVVTVEKAVGALVPADFAHVDFSLAPRLLVNSGYAERDHTVFHHDFVYPAPELAAFLGERGIVLYGADAPSMDAVDSKGLVGHHALLRHGIGILEGLDLRNAADGVYDFVALPLKIMGGDGSPVRAVLREIED